MSTQNEETNQSLTPRVYLFTVVAFNEVTRVNYIEPNLLIDFSPQAAAHHGLAAIKAKHPGCSKYEVGVVHEVPPSMIADIKRLV